MVPGRTPDIGGLSIFLNLISMIFDSQEKIKCEDPYFLKE